MRHTQTGVKGGLGIPSKLTQKHERGEQKESRIKRKKQKTNRIRGSSANMFFSVESMLWGCSGKGKGAFLWHGTHIFPSVAPPFFFIMGSVFFSSCGSNILSPPCSLIDDHLSWAFTVCEQGCKYEGLMICGDGFICLFFVFCGFGVFFKYIII